MFEYLPELLTVAVVHLLAVISPGPDFAMVCRNSIVCGRRSGVYASFGLALGIMVHVAYCLIGLAAVISQSIVLFSVIKYFGAAYLIYVGIQALRARSREFSISLHGDDKTRVSALQAVRLGFLTNVLNPKATLFFLALFTQVISPTTPLYVKLIYGGEMVIMTFLWFAFVSIVLSLGQVRAQFGKIAVHVERVFGGILTLLGIKVALGSNP